MFGCPYVKWGAVLSDSQYFLQGGYSGKCLSHAVVAQGAHALLDSCLLDDVCSGSFDNQFFYVVVD